MEYTKSLPLSLRGNHRLQISTLRSRAELIDSVCSRREAGQKVPGIDDDDEGEVVSMTGPNQMVPWDLMTLLAISSIVST
ncbi:hypothetical protein TNCV_2534531 [Trichonephila clavipes]|nr:hypothetical protein TNCV_2534531 [Trichonephila clavipes]